MQTTRNRPLAVLAAIALAASGCSAAAQAAQPTDGPAQAADGRVEGRAPNVVDIVATGHQLEGPDEVPSGWVTFRLHNESDETHFALIDLMPEFEGEQMTYLDSLAEVVPVFQAAMDLIDAGDPGAGFAEFANLPAWFAEVVYMGGPGFVAPGETAETTVYLEPGTYAIECYVMNPDGVFHTTHGMITGLEVTDEVAGAAEPRADVEVTVSGAEGFEVDGDFRPGRQTVAVHFADQTVHGNALGHDLHIARVDEDTDLDALGVWMNWITGLRTPAPVEFLGGTHDMPQGSTAYVTVDLTPGSYVLIAEVDEPDSKGMLHTFDIP